MFCVFAATMLDPIGLVDVFPRMRKSYVMKGDPAAEFLRLCQQASHPCSDGA
jgi:hypothetical protein